MSSLKRRLGTFTVCPHGTKLVVDPCAKPRATRKDKWNPSLRVQHYRFFADVLRLAVKNAKLTFIPDQPLSLTFVIPMPASWSNSKKAAHQDQPHTQTPDLDNLIKAFKDALFSQDCEFWHYGEMKKVWGYEGAIIVH